MRVEILPDAESASLRAAEFIAALARASIERRGRFAVALSGGETPLRMLELLARQDIDWKSVHVLQADERVVPEGSPERNLAQLRERLLARVALPQQQIHPMPVGELPPERAAADYGRELSRVCGSPPVIDLVQLGLGLDGHTASLVPGDPALEVREADVAVTGEYRGCLRMTLTFAAINRARAVLWLVTGAAKAAVLLGLRRGDAALPAARVDTRGAVCIADRAAAARIETDSTKPEPSSCPCRSKPMP